MRSFASFAALLGLAGIAFGILTMVRDAANPSLPSFTFENHGGPGPILGGVILLLSGLYLRSAVRRED